MLAAVRLDAAFLKYGATKLLADREIILAAVQQDASCLGYASTELRDDREIILAAVQQDASCLRYASTELRADREVILAALKKGGCHAARHVAKFAAAELLAAELELVLEAVHQDTKRKHQLVERYTRMSSQAVSPRRARARNFGAWAKALAALPTATPATAPAAAAPSAAPAAPATAPAAAPAAATAEAHDGAATDQVAEHGAEPAPAPVSDKVEHLNKLLAEQKSAPAPQTKEKTGVITDEELTSQHAIDESQISDRLSKPLLARKTARLNAAPALAPVPTPEELALKAARLNVQLERRKNAAPAPAPVPTPAEDAPSAGELEADVYVLLTAIRWATLNGHIERCLETLKVLEAWDPPAGEGPFPAEVRASLQKEWVRMFGEYGAIPPSMLVNERRFLERNYDNRSLELRLRHRL